MSTITIRVYGIFIENNQVLVSDEFIHGQYVTKFPGGGLKFGEGTIDCLKREMMEEAGQEIEVLEHLYTTDYFQRSVFDSTKQVFSVYYFFRFTSPISFPVKENPFDFEELKDQAQSFRWINLSKIKKEDFHLAIDQKVAEILIDRLNKSF